MTGNAMCAGFSSYLVLYVQFKEPSNLHGLNNYIICSLKMYEETCLDIYFLKSQILWKQDIYQTNENNKAREKLTAVTWHLIPVALKIKEDNNQEQIQSDS